MDQLINLNIGQHDRRIEQGGGANTRRHGEKRRCRGRSGGVEVSSIHVGSIETTSLSNADASAVASVLIFLNMMKMKMIIIIIIVLDSTNRNTIGIRFLFLLDEWWPSSIATHRSISKLINKTNLHD